jgi:lipopolysaccharide biosynthesis regulator YciM
VLHPPAGLDVVSFFITSRLAGQSDSDAYTDAVIEQLAALVGEPPRAALDSRARHGNTLRLLRTAAGRSEEAGRRLLLVVDGLDEDTSVGIGLPSIASLLPRRPPPGVRVLVASRPHSELPDDVAGDHPLRTLTPRPLGVSPHARDVELAAKRELSALLNGPPLPREVIGLLVASGGGLTGPDLEHLTGQVPYELYGLLGGVLGRSIGARVSPNPVVGREVERVYLFAHETLRKTAERLYGAGVAGYRDRLHSWAETYRGRGWPADTPMYLLRGYPRVLSEIGDIERLLACGTDQARHDRMLGLIGGDALALTEITTTANLILRQPVPDLAALILLALARDDLAQRNSNIPVNLPAVWITLGQPARATALANGIADAHTRIQALTLMIAAAHSAGEHDLVPRVATDAERAAREVTDPDRRAYALHRLVGVFAAAGEYDRAERVARQITHPWWWRADALSTLVGVFAVAGERERAVRVAADAERVVREIIEPGRRADALRDLAGAFVVAGERDCAERVAREIIQPWQRADALSSLVEAFVVAGERDRAECVVREVTDPGWRADALSSLAGVFVVAGEHDRAECVVREVTDPGWRVDALSSLAEVFAVAGEHDRAERVVGEVTDPGRRAEVLRELAGAFVVAGEHDRAERVVCEITNPERRAKALRGLAGVFAVAGERERAVRVAVDAERVVREITNPERRADALRSLAGVFAMAGERDRAERVVREITDSVRRAEALRDLADELLNDLGQRSDPAGARRLVAEVLNSMQWRTVLDLAARLDAPALRTVSDVLLAGTATEAATAPAP